MMRPAPARPAGPYGEALVDPEGWVWLPYDLPHLPKLKAKWSRLSSKREVRHFQRRAFKWRLPDSDELHIVNGMGVTLGDSIIGMNALAWLKTRHPRLCIRLYRTPHAPVYVERLYALARPIVAHVSYLPVPVNGLPDDAIDLSDFLYWPAFDSEPMVDLFIRNLGMSPHTVPASAKCNRWLSQLRLPMLPARWRDLTYVLFCDSASTPLRSVPPEFLYAMVDRIWHAYGLPVCGFQPILHPHYQDVSAHSRSLDQYLAWVRGAGVLVGVDSSAIHAASGFGVPTLAFFASIDPLLRVRDYPLCRVLDLRTSVTQGLHESNDPGVLLEVKRIWRRVVERDEIPWPPPVCRHHS